MTTTTPNMSLILPDVSVTAGPQWATLLNTAYNVIDGHTHATGSGVKITPAGLNISSDLTFASNNATNLRTARFFPNNTFTPGVNDRGCLYELLGELHYIDSVGNDVQLTLNGAIDVNGAITSLSLKDTSFFLQYFGDVTRQFRFDVSAIPTSTTRILSVPDSGGNTSFVTAAAAQTLTNKTLTTPVIAAINTGSTTFTLPAVDGANTNILQTNGSGVLTFVPNPGATQATATTLGAVKGGTVPGQVSGAAVAAGYIGEKISASAASQSITNTTYTTPCTVAVTAGIWRIKAYMYQAGTALMTSIRLGISTDSGAGSFSDASSSSSPTASNNTFVYINAAGGDWSTMIELTVNVSTTINYYCKTFVLGANSSAGTGSYIEAIRIA